MRRGATGALLACLVVSAPLVAGCSDDPEPVRPPVSEPASAPPAYDASLEPAAAVLALVPEDATVLAVTDFDELRLQLGSPELTGEAPARERAAFWRKVDSGTAALTEGLLRPVAERLSRRYGFGQDDVVWEAHWRGAGTTGWVLKLRDDLNMRGVRAAVDDGVGPLAGAQVAVDERVVGIGAASSPSESWAAHAELATLVGTPAAATYVERSCIPFDDAYGPGMREQLASGPAEDVARLDELGPFAVAFGSELATARLGDGREDVFERARIGDTLPEGDPGFGAGFQRPVADPAGGRIGYLIGDPRVAVQLVTERRLPFAICAD